MTYISTRDQSPVKLSLPLLLQRIPGLKWVIKIVT